MNGSEGVGDAAENWTGEVTLCIGDIIEYWLWEVAVTAGERIEGWLGDIGANRRGERVDEATGDVVVRRWASSRSIVHVNMRSA